MKIKVYQYFAWFCLGLCTACYSGMPEYEGKVGQGKEVTFRISRFDETFSRATATNFEVGDSIGIYAVKHDATGGNSFPALFGNQAHNILSKLVIPNTIKISCNINSFISKTIFIPFNMIFNQI